jgi:hypothetical protein
MRRRRRLVLFSAPALTAVALLAAGCGGGGSSPGVASVGPTTTAAATGQNQRAAVEAFARCMRSNGEPSFPDPQSDGPGVKLTIVHHAGDPHFQTAMRACNHLLPTGGQADSRPSQKQIADELSFARCMRSRGVSRFPDPNGQGQLTVEMVEAQGIDVHSQAVLRVVQKCLPASHGGLTAAKVREAIANAGNG